MDPGNNAPAFIAAAFCGWRYYFYYRCCTPPPYLAGGPCYYDTLLVPAKIVAVRADAGYVMVRVAVVTVHGQLDTLELQRQPPFRTLTLQQYDSSGLRKGDSILCKHFKISSGNCSPDIFWFAWERFTPIPAGKPKKHG